MAIDDFGDLGDSVCRKYRSFDIGDRRYEAISPIEAIPSWHMANAYRYIYIESILAISHISHWLYSINQYWLMAIAYVVSIS